MFISLKIIYLIHHFYIQLKLAFKRITNVFLTTEEKMILIECTERNEKFPYILKCYMDCEI